MRVPASAAESAPVSPGRLPKKLPRMRFTTYVVHYELGVDAMPGLAVPAAFDELARVV